jgi:hypothetical protein
MHHIFFYFKRFLHEIETEEIEPIIGGQIREYIQKENGVLNREDIDWKEVINGDNDEADDDKSKKKKKI